MPTAAERAEAHNACANALLADGLPGDAVLAYTRAINLAGGLARLGVYYANRSQARLKLEEHELAGHDAAFALSLDPTLWKARLRLMRALEAIGRSASASDAARALLAASPPAAAAQEASAVLRRQPAYSDPAPRTIVLSPTMRLRLHVGGPALGGLRRGGWQAFTVRLCNEMGLFDQQWPGCGSSLVRLRLLPLGGGGVTAAGVRLRLRQVGLHAGGGGAAEDTAAAAGGVLVRLERGRAVAEIRAEGDVEGGVEGGWGGWAVLWAAVAASGGGGSGGGGAGPPTLDFVSAPLPLLPPEAGQEVAQGAAQEAEQGGEGEGSEGGEGGDRGGTAAALIGVSAARLLEQAEAELVSCLRVLPAEDEKKEEVEGAARVHGCGGDDLMAGDGGLVGDLVGDLVVAESSAQICGRVWDGALALSRWLRRCDLRGASIVELGSGCGVCGLGAAAQGARVVMTDLPEAIPLLRLNAALAAPCCATPPTVWPLEWGCDAESLGRALAALPPAPPPPELPSELPLPLRPAAAEGGLEGAGGAAAASGQWVISSDVVYEPEAYEPLLATLCSLAAGGVAYGGVADGGVAGARPRVLMAHRSRNPDESPCGLTTSRLRLRWRCLVRAGRVASRSAEAAARGS